MQSQPAASVPALADLSPACFAMVMATGIVSLAARMHGWRAAAVALFGLNIVAWLAFGMLTALRATRYPGRFFGDLIDHRRGPGFFTTVAGTAVLGSQFATFGLPAPAAFGLGAVAAVLWFVLTYAIFTAFTIKEDKPTLDQGITGGWLLAVVATQSLAVLGAILAARSAQPWKLELNFFALSMWLWGGMLYIWMMSLIFYRYTFFRFAPSDLAPPYWINMGAMAISTLAGSLLIVNAPDAPFLQALLPFLKGFTILYWATGTWWIPMLVLLAVWRYVYKRFPLRYDPLYWGAVFPLGMYSAATHEMILALQLDFLSWVPPLFLGVAVLAWTTALLGLGRHLLRLRRTA
ncbi:tellurite resistance/C4-dicarboxylate transporter family protein [Ramlibacter sp.]|uniref:tellurite resistance/C4-dicarboxylate transporter family protein n=1 Tax=Ramlibacter sp. TaxID=1917967 RepID=UPI002CA4E5F5|nr:tellurite resistance/C4-dicarboxylate transporter family protein [Ramlibacter sp.]HWI84597.1 tellurite resistance/C4-dicarboxylate transporter family protein [Ramlibacter sp.]